MHCYGSLESPSILDDQRLLREFISDPPSRVSENATLKIHPDKSLISGVRAIVSQTVTCLSVGTCPPRQNCGGGKSVFTLMLELISIQRVSTQMRFGDV